MMLSEMWACEATVTYTNQRNYGGNTEIWRVKEQTPR